MRGGSRACLLDGLVIYEGEEEVTDANVEEEKTSRNQYVWVPVENISEFVREEGYEGGSPQSRLSSCSEPLNYSGTVASSSETAEYNKMKVSVEKYGGFYIARYEASNNSDIAQSKANQAPWVEIPWGTSMTDLSGGAVEASRKAYPETNATKEGDAVSTLIYGVQWDAVVKWLKTNYANIEKDSSGHGNYDTGSVINTGSNNEYALNNIYDLAGNVYEWTMEAYCSDYRVRRGGGYYDAGTYGPVSYRYDLNPTRTVVNVGFRSALYIK